MHMHRVVPQPWLLVSLTGPVQLMLFIKPHEGPLGRTMLYNVVPGLWNSGRPNRSAAVLEQLQRNPWWLSVNGLLNKRYYHAVPQ